MEIKQVERSVAVVNKDPKAVPEVKSYVKRFLKLDFDQYMEQFEDGDVSLPFNID